MAKSIRKSPYESPLTKVPLRKSPYESPLTKVPLRKSLKYVRKFESLNKYQCNKLLVKRWDFSKKLAVIHTKIFIKSCKDC